MKPFNLEEAKAGKPFGNKEYGKAVAIHIVPDEFEVDYPVYVLYENGEVETYTKKGWINFIIENDEYDLFMLPEEKHEWWNVFDDEAIHVLSSLERAKEDAALYLFGGSLLATIHVVRDGSGIVKKEIVE